MWRSIEWQKPRRRRESFRGRRENGHTRFSVFGEPPVDPTSSGSWKPQPIFLDIETDTEISSLSILSDVVIIITRQSNFDERFRSEARNTNSRKTFPMKSNICFNYDRLRVHSTLKQTQVKLWTCVLAHLSKVLVVRKASFFYGRVFYNDASLYKYEI